MVLRLYFGTVKEIVSYGFGSGYGSGYGSGDGSGSGDGYGYGSGDDLELIEKKRIEKGE